MKTKFTRVLPLFIGLLLLTTLSLAQNDDALQIAQQMLQDNQTDYGWTDADIADIALTRSYTDDHNGLTHIYLSQRLQGIPIDGAGLGIHYRPSGDFLHISDRFYKNTAGKYNSRIPIISAAEAVVSAASFLNLDLSGQPSVLQLLPGATQTTLLGKAGISLENIKASLVYQAVDNGQFRLSWQIRIYGLNAQHYWVINVDADNENVLASRDLVLSCSFDHQHGADACREEIMINNTNLSQASDITQTFNQTFGGNRYRVFDLPIETPNHGNRTLVYTDGDPVASPKGWHNDGLLKYTITKGNNVYAYADPSGTSVGIPATGALFPFQPLKFDFPLDLSEDPSTYRDAAVTNLFFWNNIVHDVFYHYGFTEPAGNFQQNNFGKGGLGLDAVLAEAQDGGGVNNANFLTLPDGLPGRMQMYLWDLTSPMRDGDLDNGIITHEYGHGISTRLTGGGGTLGLGCLSGDEQAGEGWSDYFALMLTMDANAVADEGQYGRGIGTYVLGESTSGDGIRPARYSVDLAVNPYTYGDITNPEISVPHGVGFMFCTVLWDMTWLLIDEYGYDPDLVNGNGGNNLALQLVVDGLKLQPCEPTFIDSRNAILAADRALTNGANECIIWEAFARRGMGWSASSGASSRGDEVEAFDLPPSCLPNITIAPDNDPESAVSPALSLSVYPNPAKDKVQLILKGRPEGRTLVRFIDANGKVMKTIDLGADQVNQKQEVDLAQLPAGMYLISISNKNQISNRRIMINRQ